MIHGFQVDGEADMVGDEDKLDHAAVPKEIRRITDSEVIVIVQDFEILAHAVYFASAEEQNFTRFCAGDVRQVSDSNRMTIDGRI